MMILEISKHVPKTEKRCRVFKDNEYITNDIITILLFFQPGLAKRSLRQKALFISLSFNILEQE